MVLVTFPWTYVCFLYLTWALLLGSIHFFICSLCTFNILPNSSTGTSLKLAETEDLVVLVTLQAGLALQPQWQPELDYSFAREDGLSCPEWAIAVEQKANIELHSELFSIFISFSVLFFNYISIAKIILLKWKNNFSHYKPFTEEMSNIKWLISYGQTKWVNMKMVCI